MLKNHFRPFFGFDICLKLVGVLLYGYIKKGLLEWRDFEWGCCTCNFIRNTSGGFSHAYALLLLDAETSSNKNEGNHEDRVKMQRYRFTSFKWNSSFLLLATATLIPTVYIPSFLIRNIGGTHLFSDDLNKIGTVNFFF